MIDVALAADSDYLPHAATVLHSLLTSNDGSGVRAHLLHPPTVSDKALGLMVRMVEELNSSISFHPIAAAKVDGLPSMGRISRVMWYRLLLGDLLPDAGRVLYLDCDTLVVDDISRLSALDLRPHPIAAVTNVFPKDLSDIPARLGIAPGAYFNSGVLLMDLDAWRADGHGPAIARLAREDPGRLVFPDQDALNIWLAHSRHPLHPRWNAQNSVFYFSWAEDVFGAEAVREARSDPAILHFEGPAHAKPWHAGSTHPYRDTYLEHRRQTPWSRIRLEGRGLAARLRRAGTG